MFRASLIRLPSYFNEGLPNWIRLLETPDDVITYLFNSNTSSNIDELRKKFEDALNSTITSFKALSLSPLEQSIKIDVEYISEQWRKALERQETDPEAAITMARTMIESVLKHIASESSLDIKDDVDLPILYKAVVRSLDLAPEQHQDEIFKQVLSGLNSVAVGLGTLRNKLGDAHGSNKHKIRAEDRHSQLAVNAAGTLANFLLKTFNAKLKKSSTS